MTRAAARVLPPLVLAAGSARAGPGDETVLVPDYGHARFQRFRAAGPGVTVTRALDLRDVPPPTLGTTGIGLENRSGAIRLDRPVAHFVEESFARLLPARDATAPRVELTVERFELGHRGRLFGATRIYFRARLAVVVLTDSGGIPAGWLDYVRTRSVEFSVRDKQAELMYQGMAEIAGALDRGQLPLARIAESGTPPAPVPTVRLGEDVDPELVRREFGPSARPTWRQVDFATTYHRWSGAQMRETFGESWGAAIRYTEWLWNGEGLRGSIGWYHKHAPPRILDPAWTIDNAAVTVDVVPIEATWLHSFTREPHPGLLPYAGLGMAALVGHEEMQLVAFGPDGDLDAKAGGLRLAFGLHAVAGAQAHVYGPFGLVAEAAWTQAFGASRPNPRFDTAEDQRVWDLMLHIARLPDCDQSGLGVRVGLVLTER